MTLALAASSHFGNPDAQDRWALSCVGQKALGLQLLPDAWTPPFFVIPTQARIDLYDGSSDSPDFDVQLSAWIQRIQSFGHDRVIVRSSAVSETLSDRGRFYSATCDCSLDAVLAMACDVKQQFRATMCLAESVGPDDLALVVQGYVDPVTVGHLSNERRVSRKGSVWRCEAEDVETSAVTAWTFSANRASSQTHQEPLLCHSEADLRRCLTRFAQEPELARGRFHLEWVWDGTRVWIVQRDEEEEHQGSPPRTLCQHAPPVRICQPLTLLHAAQDSNRNWQKIESVRIFARSGLPTPTVLVLEDVDAVSALMKGEVPAQLRRDLAEFLTVPSVIRTDIAPTLDASTFLLPRTDTISGVHAAELFLCDTARQLSAQGLRPQDICFLFHHFVSARAGAFSYSRPNVARVRVDSSWGSPDSLLYCPHDSYEVDAGTKRIVNRHVRCKTHYIDLNDDGEWVEVQSGRPWDWRSSLTEDELVRIAEQARKVADDVGRPVVIMHFVGVRDEHGREVCLPWFSTTDVLSAYEDETNVRFAGSKFTVRDYRDLTNLIDLLAQNRVRRPLGIRLRPSPGLLRCEKFLAAVAELGSQPLVSVELEGSILQHAYYCLRRMGVRVKCVDILHENTDRKQFGKLVRDRIPLRIESRGELPRTYRVTSRELIKLLKAKAVEEALELYRSVGRESITEELADLLEVLVSACRLCECSMEELQAIADEKRRERGSFEEGVVLVETESVPLITKELRECGLFSASALEESGRPHERATPLHTRHPRVENGDLIVSLVPPDAGESKGTVVSLPNGNEAVVRYVGTDIRICVRQKQERQLMLPLEWSMEDENGRVAPALIS